MKYLILIPDGAADRPIHSFGNKTIFEATDTPNLDFIARKGKMGLLKTIPDGMNPGSECANMSIMGYDPKSDLTGRGPLEALSAGVSLGDQDLAFRCNLITVSDGLIKDYSSGHIPTKEAIPLIKQLQKELGGDGVDFFPGVQYRHILRLSGEKFSEKLILTPPHDQLNKPYKQFLPKPMDTSDEKAQITADLLNELIEASYSILINHEINKTRKMKKERRATHIWPWGGGKKPKVEPFKKKYGLSGSVISAVDLIFGLGIAAGMDPIHVEGATGLPDTNYQGKVDAALKELEQKDFVYLHIEAIDEMGHSGDPEKKSAALRDFDQLIVKPFLEAEKKFNNKLKIAVLPDHPTPCSLQTHTREPVPFAIYDPTNESRDNQERGFSEKSASKGELGLIEKGEDFMRLFLK
jgi:2,3-bisphosphoglycerate-independent phosphoglycerate mutase